MPDWFCLFVCVLQTQAVSDGGKCWFLYTLVLFLVFDVPWTVQLCLPTNSDFKITLFVKRQIAEACLVCLGSVWFLPELNVQQQSSAGGSSSSLCESSSRSGGPHGPEGPASRVVSWAVCFERLLEDHVGVRYFTVSACVLWNSLWLRTEAHKYKWNEMRFVCEWRRWLRESSLHWQ